MSKIYILTFLIIGFVYIAKAQSGDGGNTEAVKAGTLAVDINDIADQYESRILLILNNRVSVMPDNLQPSGNQIIRRAEEGLKVCRNGLNFLQIIWAYRICAATELRIASAALTSLETGALSGA